MKIQHLRLSAFVILFVFFPGLLCVPGRAQDAKITDPRAVANFAGAVLRTHSVAGLRPRAIVDRIGRDPFALFDFVRDQIGFQAYRGVLRGAEGTLAARAGNAWDQAILLKTMLDYAGVRSTILRIGLDEEQARLLVDSMAPPAALPADAFGGADLAVLGLEADRYNAASSRRADKIQDLVALVTQRSNADAAALARTGSLTGPATDLVSATRDYAWVQAEINDRPYDFHPAFQPGKQPVLLPAGVMKYVTSIPTNLFHWVRIRLFIERLTDTGLDRTAILDKQVLPAVAAGTPARIALRPTAIDDRLLRLDPALAIGDTLFTGTGATVTAVEGKPLPGSATALWLEVTLLSPGEPPRVVTLTLADAFGADRERLWDEAAQIEPVPLTRSDFNLSAELYFLTGSVPAARWAEALAVPLRRLADATAMSMTIESSGLFGLVPDNPLLMSWGALLSAVIGDAYLDAPSAAALVYVPAGGGLTAKGRVLFSRYADAKTHRRDPKSAVAASRLFEALGVRHGAVAHTTGAYTLYEDGKFSDWDAESRMELFDGKERKFLLWLPADKRDHWWSMEPSGGVTLNGPGGWSVLLSESPGAATPERLLAGELARQLSGIPNDLLPPQGVRQALQVFIVQYAADPLSPLAPALSSLGLAGESRR